MKKLLSQAAEMIQKKEATIDEVVKRKDEAETHLAEVRERLNDHDTVMDYKAFTEATTEASRTENYIAQLNRLIGVVSQSSEAEKESAVKMSRALDSAIKSIYADTRERLSKDGEKILAIINEARKKQDELYQMQNRLENTFDLSFHSCIISEGVTRKRDIGYIHMGLTELLKK